MLGPNFWRHPTHGLKKCSERTRDTCDDHLDCCAVTACTYCLELEIYGEAIQYGTADQSGNHWTGTVAGHYFDAYWDRNYTTDECEFVVELDSVEVYRNDCYGGQSCRDSSDEVGVTVGYDEATLRWIKHEPLPLPHITDPDTGCKTWFCGECECSCECVCVTITEPDTTIRQGELCNVAYGCEGPRWEGQIGPFDLALALGRDSYGNCVLESSVDGEEQAAVAVTGCKDMSALITLYDGTIIQVACKICSCVQQQPPCCNRELPLDCLTGDASTDPGALPLTLTVDLTATPSYGAYDCFNGSGTLTFKTPLTGGVCCWEGRISGTCVNCNGETYNWYVDMTVCCSSSAEGWTITAIPSLPCVLDARESVTVPTSCDPVLLSGCYEPIVGCVTACILEMPPTAGPTYTMCFDIYELP